MVHHLRFILSSGEIVPGGSLAAPLAPFGLELPRVARELNERTLALYAKGTPVSVRIKVGPGRQWSAIVLPPSVSTLLRSLPPALTSPDDLGGLARQLYGLVLFLSMLQDKPASAVASTVFGTLRSIRSSSPATTRVS